MHYLVIAHDYADGLEKRQQFRKAHLEGAELLKQEGKLLYAAAIIKDGKMRGSMMVMNFPSDEAFNTWKEHEPYITGKVWERIEITECAIPPLFQ